ncbi:hypothetical protein VPHK404_0023 [Vibrio phage K404]
MYLCTYVSIIGTQSSGIKLISIRSETFWSQTKLSSPKTPIRNSI